MTEPQIARRCPECGASIRSLAFFCPQCGKEIAKADSEIANPNTSVVTAPLDGSPLDEASKLKETVVSPARELDTDTQPVEQMSKVIAPPPQKIRPTAPEPGKARGQRATDRARAAEGDVIQRVQKLRKISTVVLDEASYDPSLRFVLVAAALFLLFLMIVLLNKFIR
jgi:hypothetical protein